jgi:segregation and condensation protein A
VLLGCSGLFDFDVAFAVVDRLSQAVTLFALLEMHKLGEATWTQKKLFGPIEVEVTADGSRVSGGGRE